MAMPNHIAISIDDVFNWCRHNNTGIKQIGTKFFVNLSNLIKLQVKLDLPIFTIYLLSDDIDKSTDDYLIFSDLMADFFDDLLQDIVIKEHKVKISIFGKWYKLPGRTLEVIKSLIEQTKDYDRFFLNFCINYDGQEEIVDACKLIAKQVELGKLDSEMITKETIKENLYSSYLLPPDIVFIYGKKKLSGILLWDSINSEVVFADKSFMEFNEDDMEKINQPQHI